MLNIQGYTINDSKWKPGKYTKNEQCMFRDMADALHRKLRRCKGNWNAENAVLKHDDDFCSIGSGWYAFVLKHHGFPKKVFKIGVATGCDKDSGHRDGWLAYAAHCLSMYRAGTFDPLRLVVYDMEVYDGHYIALCEEHDGDVSGGTIWNLPKDVRHCVHNFAAAFDDGWVSEDLDESAQVYFSEIVSKFAYETERRIQREFNDIHNANILVSVKGKRVRVCLSDPIAGKGPTMRTLRILAKMGIATELVLKHEEQRRCRQESRRALVA